VLIFIVMVASDHLLNEHPDDGLKARIMFC